MGTKGNARPADANPPPMRPSRPQDTGPTTQEIERALHVDQPTQLTAAAERRVRDTWKR